MNTCSKVQKLLRTLKGFDYKVHYSGLERVCLLVLDFIFYTSAAYLVLKSVTHQLSLNVCLTFGVICLFSGLIAQIGRNIAYKSRIKELMTKSKEDE